MSKKTESDRFTKVASDLLLNVRTLVNWGLDTGNTTPEQMRLTVTARQEAAVKLIEGGMSQRQAAKVLGVDQKTISNDVRNNSSKGEEKVRTGNTAAKMHRAATASAKATEGGVTEEPTDKYRIIYADPPWDYEMMLTNKAFITYDVRDHYPVMALQAICDLPVETWLEDDAVLFLWVTSPMLEKALNVVHAWGFAYKTTFVWDKIRHNMGHYNSVRHELLYVCTRGACQPDVKQLFDSVQSIERSDKHSQKPVEFYDIIETIYTRGRKLEMFARTRREGWDVYGHLSELKAVA